MKIVIKAGRSGEFQTKSESTLQD